MLLKNTEPEHTDGGWLFADPTANWAADYWTNTAMTGPPAVSWTV